MQPRNEKNYTCCNEIPFNIKVLNRINELHLSNTDVGQFITYFNSNNSIFIVFELLTYVLNSNLEIISCSLNKGK